MLKHNHIFFFFQQDMYSLLILIWLYPNFYAITLRTISCVAIIIDKCSYPPNSFAAPHIWISGTFALVIFAGHMIKGIFFVEVNGISFDFTCLPL